MLPLCTQDGQVAGAQAGQSQVALPQAVQAGAVHGDIMVISIFHDSWWTGWDRQAVFVQILASPGTSV